METCDNNAVYVVHWPGWKRSLVCVADLYRCIDFATRHNFRLVYNKVVDATNFNHCGFTTEGLRVYQQTRIGGNFRVN